MKRYAAMSILFFLMGVPSWGVMLNSYGQNYGLLGLFVQLCGLVGLVVVARVIFKELK